MTMALSLETSPPVRPDVVLNGLDEAEAPSLSALTDGRRERRRD